MQAFHILVFLIKNITEPSENKIKSDEQGNNTGELRNILMKWFKEISYLKLTCISITSALPAVFSFGPQPCTPQETKKSVP